MRRPRRGDRHDHPQPRPDRTTAGVTMSRHAAPAAPSDPISPCRSTRPRKTWPGAASRSSTSASAIRSSPRPPFIRQALIDALDPVSQYPTVVGQRKLRQAIAGWAERRLDVTLDPETQVLPAAGSKEAIFHLPLAVAPAGSTPPADRLPVAVSYPVYDGSARYAQWRAHPVAVARGERLPSGAGARLARVLAETAHRLAQLSAQPELAPASTWPTCARQVAVARAYDILLCGDDCYLDLLLRRRPPPGLLQVAQTGVFSFGSLSKRSGMTGYRSGYIAGDATRDRRDEARAAELRGRLARFHPGRRRGGLGRRRPRCRAASDLPRQARSPRRVPDPVTATPSRAARARSICGSRSRPAWPRRRSSRVCWSTASWSAPANRSAIGGEGYFRLALVPTHRRSSTPSRSGKRSCCEPRRRRPAVGHRSDVRRADAAHHSPQSREAVEAVIAGLDRGELRLAEKGADDWVVHAWVKQAILLYFRLRQMETIEVGPFEFHDKIPLKKRPRGAGVRVVPPGVGALRRVPRARRRS